MSTSSVFYGEEWAVQATPPTRMSWGRNSGRTRRVVARKHLMSASRTGEVMVTLGLGMVWSIAGENT